MSRTRITSDDSELGHLVPEGKIAFVVDGDDRIRAGEARNEDGTVMTVSKSLRMPASLAARAEAAGHPDGFSGVVREAVAEWLERRAGLPDENADDARRALAVLQRVVARLDPAA